MIRIVVPYTKEVLDSIIYEYQEFFWPIQIVFIFFALWLLYAIWKNGNKNSKIIVSILTFFWLWLALYEMKYYLFINWFGFYIACFFILQALLLLYFGFIKEELVFVKNRASLIAAFALIVFYPIIQIFSGIHYLEISIIGILPDITVLFTLILLFMNTQKRVWTLLFLPLIWISFSFYWNYLLLFD